MSNNFNNYSNHNRNNHNSFRTNKNFQDRSDREANNSQPQEHIQEQPQEHIQGQPQEHIQEQPQEHIQEQPQEQILDKYKNDETVTQQVKVINAGKKVSSVNVRSEPDKSQNNVLFEALLDRVFNLVEDGETWVKVQSLEPPFPAGYIMKQFVEKI